MGSLILAGIVVAIALGAMGFHRRSGVRTASRVILGLLFVVTAVVTAALLYGSVALEDKGGGVLILFAIPTGLVAWFSGYALFAGARHESYFDESVPEKIRFNLAEHDTALAELRASIERKRAEKDRFWISGRRRDALRAEIERESALLRNLATLRPALEHPATYAQDER
jgi:hypothetical protein